MTSIVIILFLAFFIWVGILTLLDKFTPNSKRKVVNKRSSVVMHISIIISISIASVIEYNRFIYSTIYIPIDTNIVERGIIFKDKAYLSEYRLVGERGYVIFNTKEYSRSDRQYETIEVLNRR